MESAIIRVRPLEHLTDLVIQPKANRIIDLLYANRLPQPKYSGQTLPDSEQSDSEEENDEDEQDE